MKIISTGKKTRHIISFIVPYIHPKRDDKFLEYGYFYFHFTEWVEKQIRKFKKDWETGKMRVNKYPINIYGILLKSNIESYDNMENPDFEHFKYDSLNHLESKPIFEENDNYYEINAYLLCDLYHFTIEVERIPDGYGMPLIIFRNRFVYSKLMDE